MNDNETEVENIIVNISAWRALKYCNVGQLLRLTDLPPWYEYSSFIFNSILFWSTGFVQKTTPLSSLGYEAHLT